MSTIENSTNNHYKTPDGFDFSFISYFDILGIKDMVSSMPISYLDDIIKFTRNFSSAYGPEISYDLEKFAIKTYRFQDSFIRACEIGYIPTTDEIEPSELNKHSNIGKVICNEIISLCHIIINFLRKKIYLRGGVAIGKISFSKDYALGPGLILAHELESNYAIFPRFIVDTQSFNSLMEYTWSKAFAPSMLSIDHDGFIFIDYLKEACRECMASPHAFVSLLLEHKQWVNLFQTQIGNNINLKHKIDWMIDYHNDTVALFPGLEYKTGYNYKDLALPEPNTQVSSYRLQRINGGWHPEDSLWDRTWDLRHHLRSKK